jgi:hypothetical protein
MSFQLTEYQKTILVTITLSFIILIGLFGNILNLIVFSHESMKKISTFRYLFYLSLIDILVLAVCASDSLFTYGFFFMIRMKSNFACRVHTFFTYFLTHMSSVLLMIVSIDRVICVTSQSLSSFMIKNSAKFHIRKLSKILNLASSINESYSLNAKYFSLRKSEKLILLVAFILALINSHYLIYLSLNPIPHDLDTLNDTKTNTTKKISNKLSESITYLHENNQTHFQNNAENASNSFNNNNSIINMCYPIQKSKYEYFLVHIWIWIDTFIFSILPFTAMTISSLIILADLKAKSKNMINRMLVKKSNTRNRQLFIMLTSTNLYFIVCTLPLCINMVLYKFKLLKSEAHLLQIVFQIIAYTNNSFNFIFYLRFSQLYKEVVSKIFFNLNNRESSSNMNMRILKRANAVQLKKISNRSNVKSKDKESNEILNDAHLKDKIVVAKSHHERRKVTFGQLNRTFKRSNFSETINNNNNNISRMNFSNNFFS